MNSGLLAFIESTVKSIDIRLSTGVGVVHQSMDKGDLMSPRTATTPAPARRQAAPAPAAAARPAARPAAAPAAARPAAAPVRAAAAPARAAAQPVRAAAAPVRATAAAAPVRQPARAAAPAAAPARTGRAPAPAQRQAAPAPAPSFDEFEDKGFGEFPEEGADPGFEDFAGDGFSGGDASGEFGTDDLDATGDAGAFPDQDTGDGFGDLAGDGFSDELPPEPAEVDDYVAPKLAFGEYVLPKGAIYFKFTQDKNDAWLADGAGTPLGRKLKVDYAEGFDSAPIANRDNQPGETWVLVTSKDGTYLVITAESLLNADETPVKLRMPRGAKKSKKAAAAPAPEPLDEEMAAEGGEEGFGGEAVLESVLSEEQEDALDKLADGVNAVILAFPGFAERLQLG